MATTIKEQKEDNEITIINVERVVTFKKKIIVPKKMSEVDQKIIEQSIEQQKGYEGWSYESTDNSTFVADTYEKVTREDINKVVAFYNIEKDDTSLTSCFVVTGVIYEPLMYIGNHNFYTTWSGKTYNFARKLTAREKAMFFGE